MMMEGQDQEGVVCKYQLQIMKGKRTKRPRALLSPVTLAMASSTTTTTATTTCSGGGRNSDDSRGFDGADVSPTTSVELVESTTEEEEDMANCLILLAQGRQQTRKSPYEPPSSAAATTTTSKTAAGIDVHQCKTCDRRFPSFQALGGHRASHKKPKVNNEENNNNNKGLMFLKEDDDHDRFDNMNTTLSLQIADNKAAVLCGKSRVHECSICGAEFSSGQALGGHMRRHRTLTNAPTTTSATALSTLGTRISSSESEDHPKRPRTVLQLDLNLPAPAEDDHQKEPKFSFASKEKLLVFSASSLVDCHY